MIFIGALMKLSAISYQLSAIGYRLSAFSGKKNIMSQSDCPLIEGVNPDTCINSLLLKG